MEKMIYNGEVMQVSSDMQKELDKIISSQSDSDKPDNISLTEQFLENISTAKNMSEVREIAKKLLEKTKGSIDDN